MDHNLKSFNIHTFFREESKKSYKVMGLLNSEQVNDFEEVILESAICLPELVLIGSWVLRLEMKKRGMGIVGIPYEFDYLDLDYVTDVTTYDRLREILTIDQDKSFISDSGHFSKHRKTVILDSFVRKERSVVDIDTLMYLEKKSNLQKKRKHIEIFKNKELSNFKTATYKVLGKKIKTISIEEMFVARYKKIIKLISAQSNLMRFPSKNWHYFVLNGLLIEPNKVDEIWKREELMGSWSQEIKKLIYKFQKLCDSKKIILVDSVA